MRVTRLPRLTVQDASRDPAAEETVRAKKCMETCVAVSRASAEAWDRPMSIACFPRIQGRVLRAERLDSADAVEAERNLRDIARINRWFGGHRILIQLLRGLIRPEDRFSILDVGAGSGDMGQCIQKSFRNAKVVSLLVQILACP
jgi:hypothetical protein